MAVTNGFDETAVLGAYLQRIGFKQPTESGYPLLTVASTTTNSGRYYNTGAFHAALTVQNIYDCQPDAAISDTDFNTLLADMKRDVILSMLNMVFASQQLIDSGLLYHECGQSALVPVANNGKFAGLAFELQGTDVAAMLNNVQLLFDGAVSFNLYLYNDLKGKIATIPVTTEANVLTVQPLGNVLNYISGTVKGGKWFLGYSQNDLGSVRALRYSNGTKLFPCMRAQSFESELAGTDDFNRRVYGTTRDMYGLNVEASVYCDLTNKIVQNVHLFDELQGLMMAARTIELVLSSSRISGSERIGKESLSQWYADLKGYTNPQTGDFRTGLEHRIGKQVKEIRKAFNNCPAVQNVTI